MKKQIKLSAKVVELIRKPVAPPSKTFKDKKAYTRKKKHKVRY